MKAMLLLLAGALGACQSHGPGYTLPPPHRGAATGAGSSGSAGTTASGTGDNVQGAANTPGAGLRGGMGDWYGMCALNQQIQGAGTAEARRALIEQAMPDMAPDAIERQLQVMQQHCR